jgi:hypothetical protein
MAFAELGDGSFTLEAMVQYLGDPLRTWTPIFGASHPTYQGAESFFIGKERGSDQLNINIGGIGHWNVSSGGLFDGLENHLAVVFDASTDKLRIYVNGSILHALDVEGPLTSSSQLLLGAVGHTGVERWVGWIGPVRIMDVALDASAFLGTEDQSIPARPNRAPVISGTPGTTAIMVGEPWEFTPGASDPDGDPLVFSITNRPSWATFDPQTGRLAGIPQRPAASAVS